MDSGTQARIFIAKSTSNKLAGAFAVIGIGAAFVVKALESMREKGQLITEDDIIDVEVNDNGDAPKAVKPKRTRVRLDEQPQG